MRKPSPAMIVALFALFVALGGVGVAATGGNFILGQSNSAGNTTGLAAPVAGGKALQVTNTNTTTGSTALGLNVASGHAPFTINSSVKVAGLNADKLDNLDSGYFLPKTGKAADANKLDGLDSTAFLSDAYLASDSGRNLTDSDTTLASVTLPAGSYSIVAKANFYDNPVDGDTGDKVVHCRLLAGSSEIDYVDARISSFAKENDNDEILSFIGAAPSGGTVSLVCNGGGVVSEDTKLLATKVGTLHS
jgi:hypothetical protein